MQIKKSEQGGIGEWEEKAAPAFLVARSFNTH